MFPETMNRSASFFLLPLNGTLFSAPLRGISSLTKLFSALNRQKIISNSLTVLFLTFFGVSHAWARTEILNLRHWAAPEHTRVVIDTGEAIQYTVEKSPAKVQLNLSDVVLVKSIPREYILNKPGISKIILTPLAAGHVRVELLVTGKVEATVFKLKKFQDKPYRLVVDVTLPDREKEESKEREQVKVVKKDKIIVIDPGHGGEDPGAIGKGGAQEKDVVLAIGKKLKETLNAGEGTRAFLTREGDYYVPFKKRLSIARELGADLFVSIHADAARNRLATGSSVYCLSTGGASSAAAKILAGKENMADIIGGTADDSNSNDESDPIILNMFQTNTINRSKALGNKILNSICRVNNVKFSQVQEAPLRVLKLPEIPAVLVETAYISNPQEEMNLQDGAFQEQLAVSLAGSVREFFSLPEKNVLVATEEKRKPDKSRAGEKRRLFTTYKAAKGDTLTKIASRYHTEVGVLLRLNDMKLQDPLFVGRTLKLPVSSQDSQGDKQDIGKAEATTSPSPVRPGPLRYKVRKGDTIVKIASRHQTRVSAILKLNHMKNSDALYAGREIKLPPPQL